MKINTKVGRVPIRRCFYFVLEYVCVISLEIKIAWVKSLCPYDASSLLLILDEVSTMMKPFKNISH